MIDFDPSVGHEIRKRRPAIVLSNQGYSRLTHLVVVCPITHAAHNTLQENHFLVEVNNDKINGFINPFQFFTYDYHSRHAEFIGILDTPAFLKVKTIINDILN
ncbi:PemK family protein [Lentilactobacillus kisonensis DSM 19906 = JCM 15041]|uniref:PemK family protein n=1 Tax=Lentilactobacillus kisonensis DSM 19906 = JCM 15041 TaxID=1423766 RepID=A0A0R1NRS4_9LACO|nr:PemK family protein [Lentilactobacillus kisonensis DSM 19906 = JCM 15041]